MEQKLLEGEVMDTNNPDELTRLRESNRTMMRELGDVLKENEDLRRNLAIANAPITRLRGHLAPLYQALQAIFGDIGELPPDSSATGAAEQPSGKASAAWDEWKSKLGGAPAKIIDALLKHGNADTTQLCILIGTNRRQTVHDGIHKLNKSGLIDKNGDRFSLKKL